MSVIHVKSNTIGDFTGTVTLHPNIQARNQEYQNHAVVHFVEGAQDLYVTLTKRG